MQIRKCERVTSINMTEVATLNPDSFRSISIPFQGEGEEEFLAYLDENKSELEEIYEEFDEETLSELNKIWEPEWTEYDCSAWNGEDSWLESGEHNPDTGRFKTENSTHPN